MRHRLHRLAFPLILIVLIFLGQASASPTPFVPSTETFHRRQAKGSALPQTVVTQTVQTIQTNAGPVTQTCTITLTPVTGSKGEPLVQVVRQCTVTPASTTTSTSKASTSTASTSTAATSSLSSVRSTSVTTSASSSTSPLVFFTSIPLSSITVSPLTSSVPTPTSSSSGSSSVLTTTTSPTPSPTTGATTNASKSTNSGTAAVTVADNTSSSAASATSAAAAFQIPGKKISVLPIGLGIFAGISVIALIVVGLVTYERTKYRKIFRQRKLAEQGAGGSYSGLP